MAELAPVQGMCTGGWASEFFAIVCKMVGQIH